MYIYVGEFLCVTPVGGGGEKGGGSEREEKESILKRSRED